MSRPPACCALVPWLGRLDTLRAAFAMASTHYHVMLSGILTCLTVAQTSKLPPPSATISQVRTDRWNASRELRLRKTANLYNAIGFETMYHCTITFFSHYVNGRLVGGYLAGG
jgi:hypothetical protein